jgi:hypothetical protein
MCMSSPRAPSPPPALPEAPTPPDPNASQASADGRRKRGQGTASTILTSPRGVTESATSTGTVKTLLGS